MRLSSKAARRVAFLLGLVVFAAAVFFGYTRFARLEGLNGASGGTALQSAQPAAASGVSGGGTATVASGASGGPAGALGRGLQPRSRLSPSAADERWKKFRGSFGSELAATFTSDHRIASIRSGDVPGAPAPGFASGDKGAALSRARQILDQAGELVGLNHSFPLATASVRSDGISSQIEWVQTYDGIPVDPFGRVTIQLDEHGGLRGLYSNYISDPTIGNEPTLDADAAKDAVVSELPFKAEHPDQVQQGQLVLFAAGPQDGSSAVPLRYAYRFSIEGRELVLDASSGKILSERDQRNF